MKAEVRIVCELHGVELTSKQADVFKKALRSAVGQEYPSHTIRGLWVHHGPGNAVIFQQGYDCAVDDVMALLQSNPNASAKQLVEALGEMAGAKRH